MDFVFSWSVSKTSLLRDKAGFADLIWSPKLVLKYLLHFSAGQVCKTSLNQLRPESCMIVLTILGCFFKNLLSIESCMIVPSLQKKKTS